MIAVGDPVGTGIVPSLARPGGNITGLSSIAPDLEGKRLELLREVVPKLAHVAFFLNPANAFHAVSMRQARVAAQALGIKLQSLEVEKSEELDGAFAAIVKEKPDALLILADRIFLHNRKRMMEFATQQRLPSVNAYRELVEAGGLMSYGPSYEDMHRRAAIYVDKILKGAKPGRSTDRAADQVHVDHQSQGRQGAGPHRATDAACPRRRGNRMNGACSQK